MRSYATIHSVLILLLFLKLTTNAQDINIGAIVQSASFENRVINKDYHIWGASVVKGNDGNYYMYYSRWARELRNF